MVDTPRAFATVDSIHVSTFGPSAFVTGRFFHCLLSLLPTALGGAPGPGIARLRPVSVTSRQSDSP